MANYHTVVPGSQNDGDKTHLSQQGNRPMSVGAMGYQQTDYGTSGDKGTVIPGMEPHSTNNQTNQRQDHNPGKPIIGFLVSVSRTEEGEYWVLKQGQNTIGSGANCNIVLSESLVSGVHAVLAVHRNPGDNNRLSIGLMDKGSSNGTFVNENYIGFNPVQCKNLDKIKIGNYELLLILFDVVDYQMKKASVFSAKDEFDYSDRDMYQANDGTQM